MSNRIKFDLTPEKVKEFKQTVQALKNLTAFRISLTKMERRRAFKLGQKKQGFIDHTVQLTADKPIMLPRTIDPEIFTADAANFKTMEELTMILRNLTEEMTDTTTVMGAGVYKDARAIYKNAQVTGTDAGIKATLHDMSAAFDKKHAKKDTPGSDTSNA